MTQKSADGVALPSLGRHMSVFVVPYCASSAKAQHSMFKECIILLAGALAGGRSTWLAFLSFPKVDSQISGGGGLCLDIPISPKLKSGRLEVSEIRGW